MAHHVEVGSAGGRRSDPRGPNPDDEREHDDPTVPPVHLPEQDQRDPTVDPVVEKAPGAEDRDAPVSDPEPAPRDPGAVDVER